MAGHPQRFILRRSQADAWFIKDQKDDSLVCIVQKGKRPLEKTEAMVKVMLAALNAAGAPRKQAQEG
ncbi:MULTISPECIES: hypothetical protein [unclassified Desulfovibrio]|uniref:hypothetical protein n=1 Tax=unclassified Desulfovibrio TaxID=2593640 RepID=UPI0013EE1D2F|nr:MULTISPECIES: hypothetical protein [unclassified Desulfovibrio]